jgi:uncharacterized membrane protein
MEKETWESYQRKVLSDIEELQKQLYRLESDIVNLRVHAGAIDVKTSIMGAVSGAVAAVLIKIFSLIDLAKR